jgi:hypothetical protein
MDAVPPCGHDRKLERSESCLPAATGQTIAPSQTNKERGPFMAARQSPPAHAPLMEVSPMLFAHVLASSPPGAKRRPRYEERKITGLEASRDAPIPQDCQASVKLTRS